MGVDTNVLVEDNLPYLLTGNNLNTHFCIISSQLHIIVMLILAFLLCLFMMSELPQWSINWNYNQQKTSVGFSK